MQQLKLLLKSVEQLKDRIFSEEFKDISKTEGRFFTRKGKLGFSNILLLSLNFLSKPLFAEINNFYHNVIKDGNTVEQQSYSEARQKIKYEAFQTLYEDTVIAGISATDCKLFNGFRLLAIDGSTLRLKYSNELLDLFGHATPVEGCSFARVSAVFDVLNNMVIDAKLENYSIGERQMAIEELRYIEKYELGKYIVLMDRGYWKRELYAQIIRSGNKFLVRVPNGVTDEIRVLGLDGGRTTIKADGDKYDVRYYRFTLKSGEIETLITNLTEEEASDEQLSELYALRWKAETKYDELKNTLKLDHVTAKTYLTLMQDFYTTMLLSNLVAFAGYIAQTEIDENQSESENKYGYKPNRNVLVAALKDDLVAAVVSPSLYQRKKHMQIIEDMLSKRPVPIRPNRHFGRHPKPSRKKPFSKPTSL